jgi:hypothetical protein
VYRVIVAPDHTHTHTHTRAVGLLWTRDQAVAETPTWQYTTLTRDIHASCGIRTRNTSKRAAAYLHLGLGGHPDEDCFRYIYMERLMPYKLEQVCVAQKWITPYPYNSVRRFVRMVRLPCSVIHFACKSKILQAADASIIATISVHHVRFDQLNLSLPKLLHITIRRDMPPIHLPREHDRIISGYLGFVAIWVTHPLWPRRVPLNWRLSDIVIQFRANIMYDGNGWKFP